MSDSRKPNARTGEDPNASTPQRANAPTTSPQEVRRAIKRGSFEFYTDQLEQLQRIALEDKMQGKKGSQSEMVREALDTYLKSRGVHK